MPLPQVRAFSSLEKEYEAEVKDILTQYEERQKRRQAKIGVVVSTRCAKSITVKYAYEKYFPKYDKYITRHRKLMAHDENEQCEMGDLVRIVPCRPMSKRKRHMIIDVLRKPKLAVEDSRRKKKEKAAADAASHPADAPAAPQQA